MNCVQSYIKAAGALLLLLSMTMPLSSCDKYVDQQGRVINYSESNPDKPLPAGVKAVRTYNYFYRAFQPTVPRDWLILAGFTWPPFMIIGLWRLQGRIRLLCQILEIPLLAWSILALSLATLFHTRLEIGSYVAYAGIGAYGLGAVWADVRAIRRWRATRNT